MKEIYGNVVVVLDNPDITGSFYGVPIYNGLFIKVKGNVYTPFHSLLSDKRLQLHILEEGNYSRYDFVMNEVKDLHSVYCNERFFNSVKSVKVISSGLSPGLTAFYLKVLNLLDKSNMPVKYKEFFDGKIIDSEKNENFPTDITFSSMKTFLDKIVQEYIYSVFEEAHFKSGRVKVNKSVFPTQAIKILEMGIQKSGENPLIMLDSDIVKQYKYPVYTAFSYANTYGNYHECGVNDKFVIFYQPSLSSKLIIVKGKLQPKVYGKIIDFKTYYEYYIPKRSRGLRVVHIDTDSPVMTHCPLDDNVYFLAQTRDDITEPIIVKVPRNDIIIDFDKTRIKCCGKEFPVAGVKGSLTVAYLFSHKLISNKNE